MSGCLFGLAAIFFVIGLVQLLSPDPQPGVRSSGAAAKGNPAYRQPSGRAPHAMGAASGPVTAGASQFSASGGNMPSLSHIQLGQRVRVRHPLQGDLTLYVMGRVVFDELWQTSRGPQSPWVPTGNAYSGFWLEMNLFLLNWQNRYYLLDERIAVSDPEIQRDFAAHARKFAQSDQTAEVLFSYPPTMWRMDDIGKFRVRTVEGEGLNLSPGSVGRFIHASGSAQAESAKRGLVLEDFEGGGQDTVWIGFLLDSSDIQGA
jgi:hypothetical protein